MTANTLKYTVQVKVSLSKGRVIEADLNNHLSIDTSDLTKEVLEQPSRYALWAVMCSLSERKLEMISLKLSESHEGDQHYKNLVEEYSHVKSQHDLIQGAVDALNHRKVVLLEMWGSGRSKRSSILKEYYSNISHLVALKDVVP